jgi:hypothetical protein
MMDYGLIDFDMPSYLELSNMNKPQRINFYRCFFAHSRYNRLIIQLFMIDCAINDNLYSVATNLHNQNLADFEKIVKYFKESSYSLEFLDALREELEALKKVIDAYNNKLNQTFGKPK